jgi:hypothetical protein
MATALRAMAQSLLNFQAFTDNRTQLPTAKP